MFRFENPEYFWALSLIILWLAIQWWGYNLGIKRKNTWSKRHLVEQGKNEVVTFFSKKLNYAFLLGILFSIIALVNPQWGKKTEEVQVETVDIYIALDISNSMNAADIAPSRLEKAKKWASDFVISQKGNRLGLIFFAGNAYLQMPLTFDYAASLLYIKSATTSMAPTQGSSIGEAIAMTHTMHKKDDTQQKALVLITDGEDHEGEGLREAKLSAKKGTVIFTVGVGTENGSEVPIISDEGENLALEEDGSPAISKLNKEAIRAIAKAGNGEAYFLDNDFQIIPKINKRLSGLKKEISETRSFADFNSYFMIFIFLALCSFILAFKPWFRISKAASFILLSYCFMPALQGQSAHSLLRKGDNLYQKGRYQASEKQYEEASKKEPSFRSLYNLGNALYQQNRFAEAATAYQKAVESGKENQGLGNVYHNLGNARFQEKNYGESVAAYKKSLQYNPGDKETIENLLKARKLWQKQKKEEEKQKKEDQKNKGQKNSEKNLDNQEEQDNSNQSNQEKDQKSGKDSQKNTHKEKPNLSPEEAEKLMEIIENEDKKVNQKIRRGSGKKNEPRKPW